MAFFKEGGIGFVRPIPASDNRGSGPNFTGQTRRYGPERKLIPDGHDVQVQAINIGWSQSRVGTSGNDRLRGVNGVDYMYGLSGSDTLYGFGGDDVMFGGQGEDMLFGGEGDDELYGNAGIDRLEGEVGDDTLTGGLGVDSLWGDWQSRPKGRDVFVLQKGIAYRGDLAADFEVGVDRVGILRSEFPNLGNFSFRNGTWDNHPNTTGTWIQWQGQDMMFLWRINATSLNNDIFQYL